jgi:competence protein ComEA
MKKILLLSMACAFFTTTAMAQTTATELVTSTNKVSTLIGKAKGNSIISPININTANLADLMRIPGVGATRAQAIIAFRQEHGAFQVVEDLTKVRGFSSNFVKRNEQYLTVG